MISKKTLTLLTLGVIAVSTSFTNVMAADDPIGDIGNTTTNNTDNKVDNSADNNTDSKVNNSVDNSVDNNTDTVDNGLDAGLDDNITTEALTTATGGEGGDETAQQDNSGNESKTTQQNKSETTDKNSEKVLLQYTINLGKVTTDDKGNMTANITIEGNLDGIIKNNQSNKLLFKLQCGEVVNGEIVPETCNGTNKLEINGVTVLLLNEKGELVETLGNKDISFTDGTNTLDYNAVKNGVDILKYSLLAKITNKNPNWNKIKIVYNVSQDSIMNGYSDLQKNNSIVGLVSVLGGNETQDLVSKAIIVSAKKAVAAPVAKEKQSKKVDTETVEHTDGGIAENIVALLLIMLVLFGYTTYRKVE